MGFLDDAMDKAEDTTAEHAEHIDKGQDFLRDKTGEGDTNR